MSNNESNKKSNNEFNSEFNIDFSKVESMAELINYPREIRLQYLEYKYGESREEVLKRIEARKEELKEENACKREQRKREAAEIKAKRELSDEERALLEKFFEGLDIKIPKNSSEKSAIDSADSDKAISKHTTQVSKMNLFYRK